MLGDVGIKVTVIPTELATFNDDPAAGGITREVYSPTYERAVALTSGWMREAGLEVRRDAVGNLFARWEAGEPGPGTDNPLLETVETADWPATPAGRNYEAVRAAAAMVIEDRAPEHLDELGESDEAMVAAWDLDAGFCA